MKTLAKFSRRVLSVPASSASSERSWSQYKHVQSPKRTHIDPDRLEKLVFVYSNAGDKLPRPARSKKQNSSSEDGDSSSEGWSSDSASSAHYELSSSQVVVLDDDLLEPTRNLQDEFDNVDPFSSSRLSAEASEESKCNSDGVEPQRDSIPVVNVQPISQLPSLHQLRLGFGGSQSASQSQDWFGRSEQSKLLLHRQLINAIFVQSISVFPAVSCSSSTAQWRFAVMPFAL